MASLRTQYLLKSCPNNSVPTSIEPRQSNQFLYPLLEKNLYFYVFSQPITASVFGLNVMCDWPISTAATIHKVCGAVKLNAVYLTELEFGGSIFMLLNASIHMMHIQ